MLALVVVSQLLLRDGDRLAVEVVAQRDTRETEDGGYEIRVARGNGLNCSFCDAGTPDEEGDIDVFFDAAAFARWEPVLPDVEAVVGRVDEIGVG